MSEWTLYSKSGVAKVVVKKLDYRGEFMGESHVTFDLDSPVPVEFAFGDYLTYRGEVYTLRELPSVEKQARRSSYGGAFRYENITLQGMEWEPTHVEFTDYVPSDNNEHYTGLSTFSFYCDHPSKLLERIQACMDVAYTDGVAWTFTLSPNVDLTNFHAETIDITSGTSCWAALALMYSKWKIPYKRVGRTVTVGATAQVTAYTYEYGKDNGLLKLKRVIDTDKTIVTRLRVYGSDKNMPYRYYNNKGFINESMYMPYLMLPAVREHQAGDGHDVYLLSDNVTDYGIIDAEIHFDGSGDNEEIYPTLEGMTAEDAGVTTVTYQNDGNLDEIVSCVNPQDNGVVADGNYDADHPVDTDGVEVVKTFEVIVPYLGFDWHDKLTSEATATIIMKSGKCSAREFEVLRYDLVSESDVTQGVRLTLNRAQDEVTSYVYPNSTWTVDGGDKYVITGIEMPDTYVIAAENRLEAAAEAWLADNDHPNYRYEPSLDNIYLKKNPDDAAELIIGNKLAWVDTDLGFDGGIISGDVTIRTLSISEGKSALPEYEITLNDTVSSGTIEQLTAQVDAIMSGFAGGGGISLEQVLTQIRNVGGKMFLSKIANDAAQGVISFVKGVLFGNGDTGINENGEAKLSSIQTPSYSGTDIVSDKGFKVWEDNEGKSHMMVDYFSARIKAFFASLEIRKIEHSAGNRIESPAGNTLALVKKYGIDSHGDPYEIVDKWYARRYGFGLSWGFKLVYSVGQYFGFWQQDPSATVAFYRCYWTAEDKEDKKAVENNWRVGDQAFCETFNLRVPQGSGYASNKRYWRLVVGTGYETIEGTEYAYIDLTNIEDNVTVVGEQSQTYVCKHGYESGSDNPEAGDDVACFGNQIKPQERGGAIQYVTYDPNASQSGDGVPCVKMFSGIGGNADYPFDLSRYVIQKQSPTGVAIRADQFTIYSASGTGMTSTDPSSTLICDRGNYSSDADYAYGDLVQYRGSSWLCIASSKITNIEPSDANSSYWKIYARRGMGTPYIQLDCSNVIVSTNSEGRISSQSDIIVRPTRIEIYVDGNRVPVSAWSLPNSYVLYYNRVQYFTQSGLQPGINIGSFTASSNYVTINWQYYPIVNGQTIINPVIDSTSIAFHVVFTYKGETCEADTSIPLTVQRPGANGTNGAQGSNGLNSATVFLYQRASSTPAKPSSSLTYTFATGVLSGTLGNWSQTIPVNGNPCYVIQATAISSSATDTIASTEWSTPVVLVEDGADGSAGYNTATIYLYQRYAATTQAPTPSLPSGTLTYTFATKALSGTLGNWQQSIPSGTNPLYVTAATAYSNTATDTIASNEWSAPVVMAKNGEDGQSVMAEYSATGASGTWHSAFQTGDIYVHYSYDGGSTWTTAIRFVGKSIEFEKGIRHFASYDDLMAYLVSIESAMTDKDMGYYIADTDDGGTSEATLWYFYTQSSDPRDIQQVPFPQGGELNYLTSYDGHLWNADNTSEYWTDMGMIQGADGRGISSITENYLATPLSSGVTTSTPGWTTSVQTLTNTNKYLWNYETIAYTDGSSTNTTPAIIGVYGDKGADGTNGRGITSVTNYYLATSASSGVTRSTSGWTTGYQQVTSVNKYLWNYEDILYTDGQHAYTDPHIIGTYGVDGVDGISITLDPAAVIFNQAETSPYGIDTSGFAATVRVWQGANPLSGTFFTNNDITATNCVAAKHATLPNTIIITSINTWTDSENVTHYYSSGKVEVSVSVNGSSSVTLTLNWAANLLGDWKLSVKNDTMEAVSSMTVAVYDEDGQLTTSQLSSAITQNSLGVSLSAKKDDVETAGLHLDGQNSSINLVAGKVNFIDPNGGSNTKISIDTETGTLHATDGVFEGTLNAKSYLTQFADLETYCYNRPRSGNPNDKGFIPGYHKTMYNAQNESINIEGTWCFRVGASDMPVCLPTNIDGLVGQRVLLYNPHIAYLSFGTNATIINACAIDGDGYDIIYGTEEVIRGIGNPVRSTRDPVLIDYYEPVYEIIFADGVVELQCMPSDVAGSYEWSVVNLGTNVNKLIS